MGDKGASTRNLCPGAGWFKLSPLEIKWRRGEDEEAFLYYIFSCLARWGDHWGGHLTLTNIIIRIYKKFTWRARQICHGYCDGWRGEISFIHQFPRHALNMACRALLGLTRRLDALLDWMEWPGNLFWGKTIFESLFYIRFLLAYLDLNYEQIDVFNLCPVVFPLTNDDAMQCIWRSGGAHKQ